MNSSKMKKIINFCFRIWTCILNRLKTHRGTYIYCLWKGVKYGLTIPTKKWFRDCKAIHAMFEKFHPKNRLRAGRGVQIHFFNMIVKEFPLYDPKVLWLTTRMFSQFRLRSNFSVKLTDSNFVCWVSLRQKSLLLKLGKSIDLLTYELFYVVFKNCSDLFWEERMSRVKKTFMMSTEGLEFDIWIWYQ